MKGFSTKKVSLTDIEIRAVAHIHSESIDLGFLSQLGLRFLFYLYKSIYESETADLIVAKDQDDVVGYITGAESLRPVYLHLIKNYPIKVGISIIPSLLSLSKVKKILEVVFHTSSSAKEADSPKAELLSLAVRDEYRRFGVAKELFNQLVKQFREKEITEFKIIVGKELLAAQKFYEKMGAYKIGNVEVHKGSQSIVYKVEI